MILNFVIDTRKFYLSQYQFAICADNIKYFKSREYLIDYNIYINIFFIFS